MSKKEGISLWQIGLLFLSIYVLSTLFIQTFFNISEQLNCLFDKLDFIVCALFFMDFGVRFFQSEDKLKFMRWGWFDLISCIPVLHIFMWARLIRIFRIIRMLRAFRSIKILITFLFKNRMKGTFMSAVIISFLLLIFSSIAILNFENVSESNIRSPSDAIWWSFITFAHDPQPDKYPITLEGRIVALILLVSGVGLFGTFTAYAASWFMKPEQEKEENEIGMLKNEIKFLREELQRYPKKGIQ
jgi:voltage-gated potassium channel